jgi:tetratricopeptide (TPR) repeat protein
MASRNATLALAMLALGSASCSSETAQLRVRPMPGASDSAALTEARALVSRGEHGLAIDAWRKAVRFAPEDAQAYRGLAASYDAIGRADLGGRYHELALALAPADPALREEMARSLDRQGRPADARALRQEVAVAPAEAPVQVAQAVAVARGQSVTMDIVDVPASASASAPARAVQGIRLERVSLAETLLVTDGRRAAPTAPPARSELAAALPRPRQAVQPIAPAATRVAAAAPLRVMNAVGRRGQAARMRGHLLKAGWSAVETGDYARRMDLSRVIAPPALRADALRLAASLPFRARVVTAPEARRMVLVLGANSVRFDRSLAPGRRS